MAKKADVKVTKVKKENRHKILVEEGGRMSSDVPFKVIYEEYVDSADAAKERIKELKKEYPNNDFVYFSV